MFGRNLDPEINQLRASIPRCAWSPVGICLCEGDCLYATAELRAACVDFSEAEVREFAHVLRLLPKLQKAQKRRPWQPKSRSDYARERAVLGILKEEKEVIVAGPDLSKVITSTFKW